MTSKTPQFDAALDAILKPLVPHERVCAQCTATFEIEAEDIGFFKMLRVPPPTLCPRCRCIRRLGMLMRMPNFFRRPCAVPGHTESVITTFPPETPHVVYDLPYWYSDAWEATVYGCAYESTKPFFSQFRELFFAVPHLALERDLTSVDSEFSVGGRRGKNNYYCGGAYHSEDCSYGHDVRFSKECFDCSSTWNSELCYGTIGADHCSRCISVIDSDHCVNSAFLYDCKNCTDCFLSTNLRGKSYVFENQELTKEGYHAQVASLNLGDRTVFLETSRRFTGLIEKALHRSVVTTNAVHCVGNRLENCKNCYWAFDGDKGENLRYVRAFAGGRDCLDFDHTAEGTERCYDTVMGLGSDIHFSMYVRAGLNVEYSSECNNCENCFGCVGLRNKKFHILNRPYEENEYWKVVDAIKSAMLTNGEYGELFPAQLGLFPYQSSTAQVFYPLEGSTAALHKIPWYPEVESQMPAGIRVRDPYREVPSDIKSVPDNIVNDALICEVSEKPFRITKPELNFYRRLNVPLPTKHPWQRILERSAFICHPELFPFACPKCGDKSWSGYNNEEQKRYRIYCEKCYLHEVV